MIETLGILAKNKKILNGYKKEIIKQGFRYSLKKADIILCMGGDGTFLEAERKYPKIPKLLIRDSKVCDKCNVDLFGNFIDLIIEKKFEIETYNKLECYVNSKKTRFLAVNDIIIRNEEITQAIRFDTYIDNKKLNEEELIGDGIVVASHFGSTAYYKAITKESFTQKDGIGLAFNNIKSSLKNKVYDKDTSIKLIINRGRALIGCDNYRQKIKIKPYDEVLVKISKEKSNVVRLK